MADINRREVSDILEEMQKDSWPKAAAIFSFLSLIVSCIALFLQFKSLR